MFIDLLLISISLVQLIIIHKFVRPTNSYIALIHFFLIFQILAYQIIPVGLNFLFLNNFFSLELLYVYLINFTYFFIFIIFWKKYTISSNFININANKAFYLLFIVNVFNFMRFVKEFKLIEYDLERILFPFYGIIMNLSNLIPIIIITFSCTNLNNKMRVYIYLTFFIYIVSIITSGSRALLLMPILFYIFYNKEINFRKKITYLLCITLLVLTLLDFYTSLRYKSEINIQQAYENIKISNFFNELNFRLTIYNKISNGIAEIILNSEPVGFNPLTSSITSIIPSYFFSENNKPWPGSVDGTSFGILSRLAYDHVYHEIWNMSEYAYTLHPIWELGYLYWLLNIVGTLVWLINLEKIAFKLNDKCGILVCCSFMPFTYSLVIQPFVFIFQTMAYISILGIFILILRKFKIRSRWLNISTYNSHLKRGGLS